MQQEDSYFYFSCNTLIYYLVRYLFTRKRKKNKRIRIIKQDFSLATEGMKIHKRAESLRCTIVSKKIRSLLGILYSCLPFITRSNVSSYVGHWSCSAVFLYQLLLRLFFSFFLFFCHYNRTIILHFGGKFELDKVPPNYRGGTQKELWVGRSLGYVSLVESILKETDLVKDEPFHIQYLHPNGGGLKLMSIKNDKDIHVLFEEAHGPGTNEVHLYVR